MRCLRGVCGPFFVIAGALHFIIPETYKRIVPPYLPAPEALVYLSGVAEAAGGAGLMLRRSRRWAGRWLVATLVAVFPANLEMAFHSERYTRVPGGERALSARLPLQAVLIVWVLDASHAGAARR
jgi:uncharacterized membrane protein